MPTVSSFQAACSTSRRAWLMAIRARASRSRLPPRLAIGLPKATRLVERSQASSSDFSASPMRRMQWCTRPGPRRPWAISKARPGPARIALAGRRTSLQGDLAVAERLVVLAERGEHPLDLDAGGLERHDDHRVLAVAVGAGVGEAHEDADLAVGVAGAGRPPLAAVEHDVVAVEGGRGLHVGGVGAGDAGLGHQEGAAHPRRRAAARATPAAARASRSAAAPPCCRCRGRCS